MSARAPGRSGSSAPEELPAPLPEGMAIPLGVKPTPWYTHIRAAVLILVLTFLFAALLYPLVVTAFAQVVAPYTANANGFRHLNQTNNTTTALLPVGGPAAPDRSIAASPTALGTPVRLAAPSPPHPDPGGGRASSPREAVLARPAAFLEIAEGPLSGRG